ncbi:MAG TPA: MBOAT family O-acyltransferase [Longimicrobiales bacterium]|jgi:D-alanyl-lipoteichoic acid acyltransferase DltB (MBOAT superfamily)
MLFNSPEYGLFLVVVVAAYFGLPHRAQNRFLLVASYVFYSFWDVRFLSLILVSTTVDFVAGRRIALARGRGDGRRARVWLVASVVTNLGLLATFKYFGFFAEGLHALLAVVGLDTSSPVLEIALPVGISFYTFQTMSYTIDVWRGRMEPVDDALDFALFVAFFPQLVAGPIERASHLLPQIQAPRTVGPEDWSRGLYLILVGLVRKVVIADTAGVLVNRYFNSPERFTSLQLACGLALFAIQAYGDFAGYSNIARGSARLLGFDLMRNFRHPYFATNPSDFWHRWHVSLSSWLRDYLYIPLGGSRRGERRTYVNLVITMFLSGLWHGAGANFVLFGLLHGAYLAGYRALRRGAVVGGALPSEVEARQRATGAPYRGGRLPLPGMGPLLAGLGTFCAMSLLLLLFRAPDPATAWVYLKGMAAMSFDGQWDLAMAMGFAALTLAIDAPQALYDDEWVFLRPRPVLRGALAGAAVILIILSGNVDEPFVYFQF